MSQSTLQIRTGNKSITKIRNGSYFGSTGTTDIFYAKQA
jgi:hypothetical protein